MNEIREYVFSDATIKNVKNDAGNICIYIEDVLSRDKKLINGTLIIHGKKTIYLDEHLVDEISMYYPEADVVDLEQENDGTLSIIMNWVNYKTKEMKTVAYDIDADKFEWKPELS